MKRFLFPALILVFILHQNYFAQTESAELIARMDSSLKILVQLQKKVVDIHPCLEELHPVAVPYKDSLLIFDYDHAKGKYRLVKETSQPFPLPEGIQASFPLSVYDNKPTCIVSPQTFSYAAGYATILHEFIHCCQYNSIEPELKQGLEINRIAMENKDYSWEIIHPFPYHDSVFINFYDNYKHALEENDIEKVKQFMTKLKERLGKTDFEYMLWEEWKEGLARYVENKINDRLNFNTNNYGRDKPYNRVSFYYSGALLISRLAEKNPELPSDMELLFEKIRNF